MLIDKNTKLKVLHRYEPVVILGKGSFARDLERILQNHGFNVEALITSDELQTYPNKNTQLLIGIFNRDTPFSKLLTQATNTGFQIVFMPWEYYERFQTDLGWRYWLSYPEYIFEHLDKLRQVEQLLSDLHSIELLQNIIKFRTGQLIEYSHYIDNDRQYFNDLTLKYTKCYVDGGAYIGDSFQDLQQHVNVEQAFLFEPDAKNFKIMNNSVKNAVCLPLALSDKIKMVSFSTERGESSTITDNGTNTVLAVSIDDMFANTVVDFIKLDLEGGEIAALSGAKQVLAKYRPRLAVSLYHKPDDLWTIPLLLSTLCDNYNFYIRQHYYNSFDCVLYGIPK